MSDLFDDIAKVLAKRVGVAGAQPTCVECMEQGSVGGNAFDIAHHDGCWVGEITACLERARDDQVQHDNWRDGQRELSVLTYWGGCEDCAAEGYRCLTHRREG